MADHVRLGIVCVEEGPMPTGPTPPAGQIPVTFQIEGVPRVDTNGLHVPTIPAHCIIYENVLMFHYAKEQAEMRHKERFVTGKQKREGNVSTTFSNFYDLQFNVNDPRLRTIGVSMGGVADGKMALDNPVSKGRLVSMIDGVVPCKLDHRFLNGAVPGDLLEYVPAWSGRIWRAGSSEYGPCIVRVYKRGRRPVRHAEIVYDSSDDDEEGDWEEEDVEDEDGNAEDTRRSLAELVADHRDLLRSEESFIPTDFAAAMVAFRNGRIPATLEFTPLGDDLLGEASTIMLRLKNITDEHNEPLNRDVIANVIPSLFGVSGDGLVKDVDLLVKLPTGGFIVNPYYRPRIRERFTNEAKEVVLFGSRLEKFGGLPANIVNALNSNAKKFAIYPTSALVLRVMAPEDDYKNEAEFNHVFAGPQFSDLFKALRSEGHDFIVAATDRFTSTTSRGKYFMEVQLDRNCGIDLIGDIKYVTDVYAAIAATIGSDHSFSIGAKMNIIDGLRNRVLKQLRTYDSAAASVAYMGDDGAEVHDVSGHAASISSDEGTPTAVMTAIKTVFQNHVFYGEHPATRGMIFGDANIRPFGTVDGVRMYYHPKDRTTVGFQMAEYLGATIPPRPDFDLHRYFSSWMTPPIGVGSVPVTGNMNADSKLARVSAKLLASHRARMLRTGAHIDATNLDDGLYGTVHQQGAVSGALRKTRTLAEVETALKLIPSSRRRVFAVFVGHKLGTDDFDIKLLFGGEE
jgi:hypothetical protein